MYMQCIQAGRRRIRVKPLRVSFLTPRAADGVRGPAQKARVKPPLDPAKREFTTLLKIDPKE